MRLDIVNGQAERKKAAEGALPNDIWSNLTANSCRKSGPTSYSPLLAGHSDYTAAKTTLFLMVSHPQTDSTQCEVSASPQLTHNQQQEHTNACLSAEEENAHHLWGQSATRLG